MHRSPWGLTSSGSSSRSCLAKAENVSSLLSVPRIIGGVGTYVQRGLDLVLSPLKRCSHKHFVGWFELLGHIPTVEHCIHRQKKEIFL